MDYITIKNLEVFSRHGVLEEENRLGQKFAINARLYFDTKEAGSTDDLNMSVDYSSVCHFMNAFMKGHTFKLIETAAERLATDILIEYPRVTSIWLEIRKPWAPIGLPIEEVAVTIERGWHRAFLSLGSNMADREMSLKEAFYYMENNDAIRILKQSEIIETEPYGMTNQEKFLNCAMEISTLMTPEEMLTYCKNLERMAGRVKTEHWGPRPLDIDILFYDDIILDSEKLTIPHPDMQNRFFVLDPMMEIAPYVRHPGINKTIKEMREALAAK
ncbi:MAG: 2-amino-4-hydroxy-6-hydroxymethyldihydropteridine diphosphokinase [Lachnospiraceae bacterium]|nr:2-amino-4-hydroxy-6-hydroxymethyldihydropteridine diphosphokinase [Lachnospiraceae bacterium]